MVRAEYSKCIRFLTHKGDSMLNVGRTKTILSSLVMILASACNVAPTLELIDNTGGGNDSNLNNPALLEIESSFLSPHLGMTLTCVQSGDGASCELDQASNDLVSVNFIVTYTVSTANGLATYQEAVQLNGQALASQVVQFGVESEDLIGISKINVVLSTYVLQGGGGGGGFGSGPLANPIPGDQGNTNELGGGVVLGIDSGASLEF
jgi:hypothetical protein